jgi:demethylmenaquinone methyltransferase / 2-methoxy-6-polyprenyl-1,4-benzoquinol methylase
VAQLSGQERARYVQDMFGRIAGRYNLLNRVMTFGQDMRWRRFVVLQAALPRGGRLLDVASGTGDIAFQALRNDPQAQVHAADFALPMMAVGKTIAPFGERVHWSGADALALPYPAGTFHAVTSGYLLRNVIDIPGALVEQRRVLIPGGRIVILDTSPPKDNLLRPFIHFYLRRVIPAMGRILGGREAAAAYTYLPESTQAFKTPEALVALLTAAGFDQVGFRTFMFGTMAVHWGKKPAQPSG